MPTPCRTNAAVECIISTAGRRTRACDAHGGLTISCCQCVLLQCWHSAELVHTQTHKDGDMHSRATKQHQESVVALTQRQQQQQQQLKQAQRSKMLPPCPWGTHTRATAASAVVHAALRWQHNRKLSLSQAKQRKQPHMPARKSNHHPAAVDARHSAQAQAQQPIDAAKALCHQVGLAPAMLLPVFVPPVSSRPTRPGTSHRVAAHVQVKPCLGTACRATACTLHRAMLC